MCLRRGKFLIYNLLKFNPSLSKRGIEARLKKQFIHGFVLTKNEHIV